MTLLQSILLGLIQGLTEFLPISSTAHLLLAQYAFNWRFPEGQAFSFDVLVQLGTMVSLIVYFRSELATILRGAFLGLWHKHPFATPAARLGWYLVIATLPALAAGVVFKGLVERLFSQPGIAAAVRLAVTCVLLIIAELLGKRNRTLESLSWKDAGWVGLVQVLSIFPGASRSGSCMVGGMTRHLDRPAAARFTFLMSIPVMLAAGLYQSIDLLKVPDLGSFFPTLMTGFATAAVVGYLAIHWLLGYLNRRSLAVFAVYCALVSVALFIAAWVVR